MHPFTKFLLIAGAACFVIALLWEIGGKYLGLGRLPGDISVDRGNFKFYFPIVTCIVLSILLTLLLNLFGRFFK
jgi:hypothetical protein